MTDSVNDLPIQPPAEPPLPAEEPFEGEDVPDSELDVDHETFIDRARDTGVGVEDENIVGDVGPTDVPPGTDPESVG